jgi:hypothetical protein
MPVYPVHQAFHESGQFGNHSDAQEEACIVSEQEEGAEDHEAYWLRGERPSKRVRPRISASRSVGASALEMRHA